MTALIALTAKGEPRNAVQSSKAPLLETPLVAKASRKLSSTRSIGSLWRLGFLASGDGLWSKVDYDSSASKGLGWAVGLQLENRAWRSIRVHMAAQYQYLRLGRSLDGSGVISDSAVEVQHAISGISAKLGLGYLLEGDDPYLSINGDPHWWLDAGIQYLLPLTVTQTTSFSSDVSYEEGNYLFVYLGPSGDFTVGNDTLASISLQAMGTAENPLKTFGIRLALALTYGL